MDKLQEFTYTNMLIEKYGSLLTKAQLNIMEQYYCYNLSLSEIADNNEISRNAVLDCIKKSTHKLNMYEEKLGLLKKDEEILKQIEKIKENPNDTAILKLERMIKDGI